MQPIQRWRSFSPKIAAPLGRVSQVALPGNMLLLRSNRFVFGLRPFHCRKGSRCFSSMLRYGDREGMYFSTGINPSFSTLRSFAGSPPKFHQTLDAIPAVNPYCLPILCTSRALKRSRHISYSFLHWRWDEPRTLNVTDPIFVIHLYPSLLVYVIGTLFFHVFLQICLIQ
jgi:hypothetical protein